MNKAAQLKEINTIDFSRTIVQLAVVYYYFQDRHHKYALKFVRTEDKVDRKLNDIVKRVSSSATKVESYDYESQELEEGEMQIISAGQTSFPDLLQVINDSDSENDVAETEDDLTKAKGYAIIIRKSEAIVAIGYKILPENWKLKKKRGLIPLLFHEQEFKDLEDKPVFSISPSVDFLFFNDNIYIVSKKNFEIALNFRLGMLKKAEEFYTQLNSMHLVDDIQAIKELIGDNMRFLRKIASIQKNRHYQNTEFMANLKKVNEKRKWGLEFQGEKVIIKAENISVILTVLNNKRLLSEITQETFDVEFAKPVEPG